MSEEEINVYNLYNYVSYEYNTEKQMLCIKWDHTNKQIDKLMDYESVMRDEDIISNHCWVREIKNVSGWTKGNRLYLRAYHFYNGMFCIKHKNNTNGVYAYEEIDEDGFLLLRKFNEDKSYYGELERVDCIYNRNNLIESE